MTSTEGALSRSLREARRRIGLSQTQVARELEDRGVPAFYPQTVAKLESGARELKFREGIELAFLYGVAPETLAGPLAPAGDDRVEAAAVRMDRIQTQTAATEFGEVVRKRRTANGWTQTELGERMKDYGLRMSKQVVAGLENGKRPTSMDGLLALARVFGTSITRLVEPVDVALGIRPLSVEATTVMDEATLNLIADQVAARIATAILEETS